MKFCDNFLGLFFRKGKLLLGFSLWALLFLNLSLNAQQIISGEYFWDLDPGLGNGIAISAKDLSFDEAIETSLMNTSTFPGQGVHSFNVRLEDSTGSWGPVFSAIIAIEDSLELTLPEFAFCEFFWDTDPGQGNGISLLSLDGNFDEDIETAVYNTSSLPSSGPHTLNFRYRDVHGTWGEVFSYVVSIEDTLRVDPIEITNAEAFWDTDPGLGNGIPMGALDGNLDEILETVSDSFSTASLSFGFHLFNIRLKDDLGDWGEVFSWAVFVNSTQRPEIDSIYGPDFFCSDQNLNGILYTVDSQQLTTFNWTISGGVIVSGNGTDSITVDWSGTGTHLLQVEGCNTNGCGDSITINVQVEAAPVASINPSGPLTICAGDSTVLSAVNSLGYSVQWQVNGISISGATDTLLTVSASGSYTAIYSSSGGCIDTSSAVVVTENALLLADAGSDRAFCSGDSVLLGGSPSATGGTANYQYNWSPANGLSNAFSANPSASPTGIMQYTLTVADQVGCQATSQVELTPIQVTATVTGSGTICTGGQILLGASGGTQYSWSPSAGLSNALVASPIASPTQTTNYVVTVMEQGCSDTASVEVNVSPLPSAQIAQSGILTICTGDSTTLTAINSQGFTVQWLLDGVPISGATDTFYNAYIGGFYTVAYAGSGNCADTSSAVTVDLNPMLIADAGPDKVFCAGDTTVLGGSPSANGGTGAYQYNWSPATGLSSVSVPTPDAFPAGATQYTLTVTDQAGCEATSQVLVTPFQVNATATGGGVICGGGQAQLNASGGTQYSWSPFVGLSNVGIPSPIASPAQTTTYVVTVFDQGCSDTASVVVDVRPVPSAQVFPSGLVEICAGEDTVLTALNTQGFAVQWHMNGIPVPGATDTLFTASALGSYSVVYTGSGSCADTSSETTITTNPAFLYADADSDRVFCYGDSVRLGGDPAAQGGSAPYFYNWSPTTGLSNASISNPNASPSGIVQYTLTVVDWMGCEATSQVEVTPIQINATATGGGSICTGGQVQLGAAGGTQYSWSPATGLSNTLIASPIASPVQTTNYVVTVTDQGCSDTVSVVVDVLPLPTAQVSPSGYFEICPGDSTVLTAVNSQGFSVQWYFNGMPVSGGTDTLLTVSALGSYTVVYSGSGSCTDTSSAVIVSINPTPLSADAGPDIDFCMGDSVLLGGNPSATGGVAPYLYNWSPASGLSNTIASNPGASPSGIVQYTLTVTDQAGCEASSQVEVTPIQINATATGGGAICSGDQVQLGAAGGTQYSWSPATGLSNASVASPIASPVQTTNYVVTVTDQGCSDTASVLVDVLPLPTAQVSPSGYFEICPGDSTVLTAVNSQGFSVQWYFNGMPVSGGTDTLLTVSTLGSYTVVYSGSGSCTDTSSAVIVSINPTPLSADAGPDIDFCMGDSVLLGGNPSATGGVAPYLYNWSPASGLSNTIASNPGASPSGIVQYTLTVTDQAGCEASSQVEVTPIQINATATGGGAICSGDQVQLGAAGGTQYSWSPATGLSNASVASPIASPVQTTNYVVTMTDQGCSDTASVLVDVLPLPTAQVSPSGYFEICPGDSTVLTAVNSQGFSVQWYFNGMPVSGGTDTLLTVSALGSYTVVYSGSGSCTDTSSAVIVSINPTPLSADAGPDIDFCMGDSVLLGGNPSATGGVAPYLYNWSPASGLSNTIASNPGASPSGIVQYTLTVTDQAGCEASSQVEVTPIQINATATGGGAICSGDQVQLGAAGGTQYSWSPATGLSNASIASPIASPVQTTNYVVTVTDQGCSDTASVVVDVLPLPLAQIAQTGTITICSGDSTLLTAINSLGFSVQWQLNGTPINGATDTLYAATVSGSYSVLYSGVTGCADTSSVVIVVVNPVLIVDAGPDTLICNGNTYSLGGLPTATGGSGPYSYTWSPVFGLSNPLTSNPLVTLSPGFNTYSVSVVDGNNCQASDQVDLNSVIVAASVSGDTSNCFGDSIQVFASGGTQYTWFPTAGLSDPFVSDPFAFPTSTTTFSVAVDDQGCRDTAVVEIRLDSLGQVMVSNDTSICPGQSVQISASGGQYYSWTPVSSLSNPNIANPVAAPGISTTYSVIITSGVCRDSGEVNISISPLTTAGFSFVTNQATVDFNSTSINALNLMWDFGDGNTGTGIAPSHTYSIPGTYQVCLEATNECGLDSVCDSVVVSFVGISESELLVGGISVYPNPNNGSFYVDLDGWGQGEILEIEVWNLHGQMVWNEVRKTATTETQPIKVSNTTSGLYLLRIRSETQIIQKKIEIVR